jgi:type VI secretion system secreted protein Hcp
MTEPKPKLAGSLVRRPLLAAALAASAVTPAPAMAAYDIFMKMDNLVGEVTQKNYEKWIELFSYSAGFVAKTGGVGGAAAGRASCSPFGLMKPVDRASPPLVAAVMAGQRFQKAEIDFVRTSGGRGPGGPFLKYLLQDVVVSSLQESGAEGGENTPDETLALTYSKITITYYPQNSDGSPGDAVVATANCLPAVQ